MVQSEVADRLAATPGLQGLRHPVGQGRLVRRRTPRRRLGRTSSGRPPTSTPGLVALTRRDPPATTATREEVFAVVDAAFAQRRKTLRAALRASGRVDGGRASALRAPGSTPQARGEVLDIARLRPDRRGARRR